jgi:hypothetical protein
MKTRMRSIITGMFLLCALSGNCQIYAIGIADNTSCLFPSPEGHPLFFKIEDATIRIPKGSKVYCFGKKDTVVEFGNRCSWYAAAYKNYFGYIPQGGIHFPADQNPKLLPELSKVSKDEALKVAFQNFEKDSLQIIQKKYDDSVFIVKHNEEEKKEKIKDSILLTKIHREDSVENIKKMRTIIKNGFGILTYDFEETVYGFVDFSIGVGNYNAKTIKYIWITITAYNPVDDPIQTKTVQAVGPIYFKDTGSYIFDNVFYTKVFKYGVIKKVRILYTDGSNREISGQTLESIIY